MWELKELVARKDLHSTMSRPLIDVTFHYLLGRMSPNISPGSLRLLLLLPTCHPGPWTFRGVHMSPRFTRKEPASTREKRLSEDQLAVGESFLDRIFTRSILSRTFLQQWHLDCVCIYASGRRLRAHENIYLDHISVAHVLHRPSSDSYKLKSLGGGNIRFIMCVPIFWVSKNPMMDNEAHRQCQVPLPLGYTMPFHVSIAWSVHFSAWFARFYFRNILRCLDWVHIGSILSFFTHICMKCGVER